MRFCFSFNQDPLIRVLGWDGGPAPLLHTRLAPDGSLQNLLWSPAMQAERSVVLVANLLASELCGTQNCPTALLETPGEALARALAHGCARLESDPWVDAHVLLFVEDQMGGAEALMRAAAAHSAAAGRHCTLLEFLGM